MSEGDFGTIRWSLDDGLATITLARPDKRNAVNQTMFEELGRATGMAEDDPGVRAVLVRGEGPSFCAGIDLSLIGELAGLAHGAAGRDFSTFVHLAQRPFRRLALMAKPSVAAIQGHAFGAGFQLALACDLRVAGGDVQFGMLEARYGIIPDLGGMHQLARLVGPARAKELVWTTRTVGSDEAERTGLANLVVDGKSLHDQAEQLARQVMAHSPTAVGLAKDLIGRAFQTPLDQEFDLEAEAQHVALSGEDHRESVAAFLEGRPPMFGASRRNDQESLDT
jgi:2-(1,2-epoxy-1,2-dihydrophenyl)acetyl-CoA isomerase